MGQCTETCNNTLYCFDTEKGKEVKTIENDDQNLTTSDGGYEDPSSYIHRESPGRQCLENGAAYTGDHLNGKKHGHGVQVWPCGSRYEGNFENDTACGTGTLVTEDGNTYEGEWLNDKAHGKGIYKYSSGNMYKGDFKEDM